MITKPNRNDGVWPTKNAALALALMTAGARTASPHVTNLYTATKLKDLKCGSASEAEKKGLAGDVTYYFAADARLEKLLAAWDGQKAIMAKAEKGETLTPAEADLSLSDDLFMRAAAQLLGNRPHFLKLWKQTSALLKVDDGENSFRIISTNAGAKIRQQLGFTK